MLWIWKVIRYCCSRCFCCCCCCWCCSYFQSSIPISIFIDILVMISFLTAQTICMYSIYLLSSSDQKIISRYTYVLCTQLKIGACNYLMHFLSHLPKEISFIHSDIFKVRINTHWKRQQYGFGFFSVLISRTRATITVTATTITAKLYFQLWNLKVLLPNDGKKSSRCVAYLGQKLTSIKWLRNLCVFFPSFEFLHNTIRM